MEKQIFMRKSMQRGNVIKTSILSIFRLFTCYPKLLIEVFIRRRFGERYFSFSTSLILAFLLAVYPVIAVKISNLSITKMDRLRASMSGINEPEASILPDYLTWYIFIAVFVYVCWRHQQEKRRLPNTYDFALLSTFSGIVYQGFFSMKMPHGRPVTIRDIECYIEPALFFCIGFLLYLIGQNLGELLMICSLFYSMNYIAEYTEGDHAMLTIIDQMIVNKNMEQVIFGDVNPEDAEGVQWRARKTTSDAVKRKIVEVMTDDEEILTAE